MPKPLELKDQVFDKLTVVRRSEVVDGRVTWLCKCDCGKSITVPGSSLKSGNTTSCGCKRAESNRQDLMVRFMSKVRKTKKCWWWTAGTNEWGYGIIMVDGKCTLSHRLSYEMFSGPIPDGMDVLHSCDNPACVNPEHLSPGDDAKNTQDKIERDRVPVIYSHDLVREIRVSVKDGEEQKSVVSRTGMSAAQVSRIVNGRRRSSVK